MKPDDEPDEQETALGGLKPRPAAAPTLGPEGEPAPPDRRNIIDDRYQGASEIARGGMGRVLVATDSVLGRTVAVKEALVTDSDAIRRFQREVRITARLEHPSIVPVYDAGTTTDGQPFYVMRKVSGRPLDQLVSEATTLDHRLALVPHVLAAAQAVAHAHERGILHRDLKPTNILVGNLGETVVIDWGLAKVVGEAEDPFTASTVESAGAGDSLRTRIGTVFGTPGFMPPEQVRGEGVDARGDVYALGATLYYVLSRRPPHAARSGEDMMSAAMSGPPTPVGALAPGTPRELVAIVDKALAFENDDRYPDGGAFADDLNRFLKGQLVASHTYTKAERVLRMVRRNRVSVVAVTLAVVALALGGTVAVRRIVSERDRADAAAQLASLKRAEAESARLHAVERAESLMLTQARALVKTDPTAAVASLKLLAAQSERWPLLWQRARGIAAAARSNGVAFQIPGPERTFFMEMAPDGNQFLAISFEGEVYLADIGRRSARQIKKLARGMPGHFVGNRHVALFDPLGASYTLLEIATGTTRVVRATSKMKRVEGTSTHVLWTDELGKLWRCAIDSTTPELVSDVAMETYTVSPDQRLVAAATKQGVFVYTLDGPLTPPRMLGPRGGARVLVWDSASSIVGAAYEKTVMRYYLDGRPTDVKELSAFVYTLALTSTSMLVASTNGLLRPHGDEMVAIAPGTLDLLTAVQTSVRDLQLAHVSGKLLVYSPTGVGELVMPTSDVERVLAAPYSPYIIGATPGRFIVWDADAFYPPRKVFDDIHVAYPADNSEFIFADNVRWHWYDAATDTRDLLSPRLPAVFYRAAGRDGHVLFTQVVNGPANAFLAKKDGALTVLHEEATLGGIAVDGSVIIGTARGAVVSYDRDGRSRQTLVARKSEVMAIAYEGTWVAAVWADGTVWRRDLSSKREDTLPPPPKYNTKNPDVAVRQDGSVLFPDGNKLMQWGLDGETEILAALPRPITGMVHTKQLHVMMTDDAAVYVGPRDGVGRFRPWTPSGSKPNFSLAWDRDLAANPSGAGTIEVSDLVTGERWPIGQPNLMPFSSNVTLSADGKLVGALAYGEHGHFMLYKVTLPETAEDTADWLEALTNAVATPDSTTVTWR